MLSRLSPLLKQLYCTSNQIGNCCHISAETQFQFSQVVMAFRFTVYLAEDFRLYITTWLNKNSHYIQNGFEVLF